MYQGYRGHKIKDKDVIVARTRRKMLSILQKKYQKRGNAIEPVIGRIKKWLKRMRAISKEK